MDVYDENRDDALTWLHQSWEGDLREEARAAVAAGLEPVLGLSFYTWNAAEFLTIAAAAKRDGAKRSGERMHASLLSQGASPLVMAMRSSIGAVKLALSSTSDSRK